MNALLKNGSRFNLLPMNSFSREMNRWIDELTGDANVASHAPASIWESDSHYHLEFDMPGVVPEDVEVKILENTLHVSANRPAKSDVNYLRQERHFGMVERQFSLPSRVDDSQIEAELNHGVLKITVPKAPESQVKKIEIKSS